MPRVLRQLSRSLLDLRMARTLPLMARAERLRDRREAPGDDPGADRAVEEAVRWLCRAQDGSRTNDGGFARHFSLIEGWGPSYPETTGYIVPTLLAYAEESGEPEPVERSRRALDWLVSIQLDDGAFQGGVVDAEPVVPVTFNTGQILFALVAGLRAFGEAYRGPMRRAADWLVRTQDPDGSWPRHQSPFAKPGIKVYDTHVAWALLEAERVEPGRSYADAAMANVRWALGHQHSNGWFADCCLDDPSRPLTHTLGYALRGIIEAHRFRPDPALLRAARAAADGLAAATRADGFLPGRLTASWRGPVPWCCLTGSAQIAACWFLLDEATGERRYTDIASSVNCYVRRTVRYCDDPGIRGGVKGSFPVNGGYCAYQLPNWAAKFMIDANLMERRFALAAAVADAS